jgi:membrane fusion protein, copper/silver efflux system
MISTFLAVGIFLAGYMANRQHDPAVSSASDKQEIRYTCPMHPQYKADRSGTCPVCGMSLVLTNSGDLPADSNSVQSGTVRISADRRQLVGVLTDEVKESPANQVIRVPGRIAVDEQRLYRITAGADGWIRDLGPNSSGSFVRKNQILGSYYSSGLVGAIQTYIFALQTNAQAQSGDATIGYQRGTTVLSLQVALDNLRTLGMGDIQIEEIRRTRVSPEKINIYSPANGFVISRGILPQQRFDKGVEMYRIADISHVWLQTDIFEKDREFVTPESIAAVHYRGHEFHARMSEALPQFDPESRILKTRFELNNPDSVLLPDMFVDVELQTKKPPAITVPSDAVIDSGRMKTVYVELADGMFEPRLIETGWQIGSRVQITKGLHLGERVVVSGNFLIDSESRMNRAPAGAIQETGNGKTVKDLVCGMEVNPQSAGVLKAQYKGENYFFCAEMCKKSFEANPGKYIHKAMAASDMHGTGMP